ncbi:hypothetical protein PC110_g10457 [Phytophthora cactorum]|uniref:Uncharacterized protein n=2 Tax=Phytophthora cactorum TaxID=29920 RepID=A0A329S9D9_9STRA|nr:hypothetical protein PC112_g10686 [Phytophthora cactorum]KAG2857277.1 hypothetical protein PC113_g10839 [Phytophthora cactorum]KAG2921488.1 hypothetical protein PC115_g9509 [Phytophthora cactorum]RAW33229.1 hypothetical protein PC110_g10457 [Phytophthora cactorum]
MKGQEHKENFPNVSAIVTFIKNKRRAEALTTRDIMKYMRQIEPDWVINYVADKKSGLLTLQCMCECLANRHDFTSQKPTDDLK